MISFFSPQFCSVGAEHVHFLQSSPLGSTLRRRLDQHFRLRRDLQLLGADSLHSPRHRIPNLGVLAGLCPALLRLRLASRASHVDLPNSAAGQQTFGFLRSPLPVGLDKRFLRGVFLQGRCAALWLPNGAYLALAAVVLVRFLNFDGGLINGFVQ